MQLPDTAGIKGTGLFSPSPLDVNPSLIDIADYLDNREPLMRPKPMPKSKPSTVPGWLQTDRARAALPGDAQRISR